MQSHRGWFGTQRTEFVRWILLFASNFCFSLGLRDTCRNVYYRPISQQREVLCGCYSWGQSTRKSCCCQDFAWRYFFRHRLAIEGLRHLTQFSFWHAGVLEKFHKSSEAFTRQFLGVVLRGPCFVFSTWKGGVLDGWLVWETAWPKETWLCGKR